MLLQSTLNGLNLGSYTLAKSEWQSGKKRSISILNQAIIADMEIFLLALVLGAAVYTDLKNNRIYNLNSLFALFGGFALHALAFPLPTAVLHTFLGGLGGFLIFIPFYLKKGMAAGDVKLMASCAAILGWPYGLLGAGICLVSGSFLAIYYLSVRSGMTSLSSVLTRLFSRDSSVDVQPAGSLSSVAEPTQTDNSVGKIRFPYALAIAFGCLTAAFLKQTQ